MPLNTKTKSEHKAQDSKSYYHLITRKVQNTVTAGSQDRASLHLSIHQETDFSQR